MIIQKTSVFPASRDVVFQKPQSALAGRKDGFNIKSQLLKLLVIFPAASAIAAWICSLIG